MTHPVLPFHLYHKLQGGEEEKPLASTATATAAGAAAEGNSGGIIAPGLASLMQSSKPDQKTTLDPDGKRLQIDDLIIIPGNHGLGMAGVRTHGGPWRKAVKRTGDGAE